MAAPITEAVTGWLASFGTTPPFAVSIPTARGILGDKSRSELYAAIGRGELDAVKDGTKTLIVVASIVRYVVRMQPAKIKVPPPRKRWSKSTKQSRGEAQTNL
jgi:hypothetical protein